MYAITHTGKRLRRKANSSYIEIANLKHDTLYEVLEAIKREGYYSIRVIEDGNSVDFWTEVDKEMALSNYFKCYGDSEVVWFSEM